MRSVLMVALGGAVGSSLRYLVTLASVRWLGAAFPYGTLAVNAMGSLLVGALAPVLVASPGVGPATRAFVLTGLMGGFTTYATFNHETLMLAVNGRAGLAVLNVALTVSLCLGAGFLSWRLVGA